MSCSPDSSPSRGRSRRLWGKSCTSGPSRRILWWLSAGALVLLAGSLIAWLATRPRENSEDSPAEPGEVRVFEGHAGCVRVVTFSPDGTLALSGGADGSARLWDVS